MPAIVKARRPPPPPRLFSKKEFYNVAREWEGETAFIVAGGDSVRTQNLELLRGRKVVAINRSYERVPWADILYFGDSRFWSVHREQIKAFAGRVFTVAGAAPDTKILRLRKRLPPGLSGSTNELTQRRTSLVAAINLLKHLGVTTIVLLGADAKKSADGRTHHHDPHPWAHLADAYAEQIKDLATIVAPLQAAGIRVINASPGSAIPFWPVMTLEEAMSEVDGIVLVDETSAGPVYPIAPAPNLGKPRPLTTGEPVRIYCGTSANDEDIEFMAVLDYCLKKFATRPIDLTWMRLSRDPASFWYSNPQKREGWNTSGWATPFSALRWGIPEACQWQGKAIYMDVDMIPRADIAELWTQEIHPASAMISKTQAICVSMYDCAKMKAIIRPVAEWKGTAQAYKQIRDKVMKTPNVIHRYRNNWNTLDGKMDDGRPYASIDDPDIKILHCTDIPTQPHLKYAVARLKAEGRRHWYNKPRPIGPHPRREINELFDRLLVEAMEHGHNPDNYRNPEGHFGDYGR